MNEAFRTVYSLLGLDYEKEFHLVNEKSAGADKSDDEDDWANRITLSQLTDHS